MVRPVSYYSQASGSNEDYSDYSEDFTGDDYSDAEDDSADYSNYRRSHRNSSKFVRRSSRAQGKRWVPSKSNVSPSTLAIVGLFGLLLIVLLGWMGLRALDKSGREESVPPSQTEWEFRTTDDFARQMITKHPEILPTMWKADNRGPWWTEQPAQYWPTVEDKRAQESTYTYLTGAGRMEFMKRCLDLEADKQDTLYNLQHVEAHRKKRWSEYPKKLRDGKIEWRPRSFLHPNSWIKYEYRHFKYLLYVVLGAGLIAVVVLFFIIAGNNKWDWNAMNDGVFTSVSPGTSGNVFAEGSVDANGNFIEAATQQRLNGSVFTRA